MKCKGNLVSLIDPSTIVHLGDTVQCLIALLYIFYPGYKLLAFRIMTKIISAEQLQPPADCTSEACYTI